METRFTTHAEAVYVARVLNLPIETVWEILRTVPFSSYAELELTVRTSLDRSLTPGTDDEFASPAF
jgi:hypothetical protein